MDYTSRLDRLYRLMLENRLDALVYGTGANFHYFTGIPVKWQREHEPAEPDCLLVLTHDGPKAIVSQCYADLASGFPTELIVVESRQEAGAILKRCLSGGRIGTSKSAETYLRSLVSDVMPGAECINAEALGESLRIIKDRDEIALLKKLASLTDRVMEAVVCQIRPGISQPELRDLVLRTGLSLGAQDASFPPAALFVKSGTEPSTEPFVYPKEQGLVPATSVAFDFGFLLDCYCSDFGRSFYCGPAPAHISGAYRALQAAQCELVSKMKPGQMAIGQMFGMLEAAMDRMGYGDRLRARLKDGTLGHHIGVDLHENPWLRPGCDTVLQPGMVMALEPKAWLPGEYYLRVEDIVLITEDGAEFLTTFDRELFELPV